MAIWTRQPPYLAQASGLARRLGFVRVMNGLSGANLHDAVSNQFVAPTAGASDITREVTGNGWGARTNGTTAYWEIPFTQAESIAANSTFVWVGRSNVSTAIIVRDNSTGAGMIPVWNNASQYDYRTSADHTATGTWTTGADQVIVCVSGTYRTQLWANGALLIDDTGVASGNILAPMMLSRNGTSGPNYDTTTVLFAFAISRAAAAFAPMLARNPWLLLEAPAPLLAGFTPSAGGGFSAAWARGSNSIIGAGVAR